MTRAVSPALSAGAGQPGSSAESSRTLTLFFVGLSVIWPQRGAPPFSGRALQGAAGFGRPRPGLVTPASAPAALWREAINEAR